MNPLRKALLIVCSALLATVLLGAILPLANPLTQGISRLPQPYYGVAIVEGTDGACGLDFAQLYFPARAWLHGENPYRPESPQFRDPAGRVAGYSPFSLLVSAPASSLGFRGALIAHLLLQLALFAIVAGAFLRCVGLGTLLWPFLGVCLLLLLLTPAGLSFLERGQCDLFVAASFTLLFYALWASSPRAAAAAGLASGVVAGMKWTALPLLGAVSGVACVLQRRWWALAVLAGFGVTLLAMPSFLAEFAGIMRYWESQPPDGISADRLWLLMGAPMGTSKLAFVAAGLAAGAAMLRLKPHPCTPDSFRAVFFPYALGLAVLALGVGSIVFEYRVVSLLGVAAPLLAWFEETRANRRPVDAVIAWSFAGYLLLSLRAWPFHVIRPGFMAVVHLGCAVGFLVLAGIRHRSAYRSVTAR